MCIRRETREKARRSLAFSRVSKPHTHITHMLRQCTSIVYILPWYFIRIRTVIYPAMTAFTDQYSLPNIFFDIGQL